MYKFSKKFKRWRREYGLSLLFCLCRMLMEPPRIVRERGPGLRPEEHYEFDLRHRGQL